MIEGAFSSVVGLRSFRISILAAPLTAILDKCHFPQLRKFKFSIPTELSPVISTFLSRHLKLEQLYFSPQWDNEIYGPNDFLSVSLPSLTFFTGSASLVHNLLLDSPVQVVDIWWYNLDSDYEGVIASLGSKPMRKIDTALPEWSLPLAHAISRHCPAITSLSFVNHFEEDHYGLTVQDVSICIQCTSKMLHSADMLSYRCQFMLALNDVLPSFANLRTLSLTRGSRTMPKIAELDVEFETMLTWGRLCPKLVVCTLPCVYSVFMSCLI